jgi:large subunit ribosomal protein L10
MKKSEKPFFVDNLSQELKAASSAVLVDYTGLSVKMQQELKKKLKVVNAQMLVVKNTLFKLAAEKAKVDKEVADDKALTGPTAMVITEDDPIAPLSVLGNFAKENDIPQFKVGLVEGSLQDKESLVRLSKLPGKEFLLAQSVSYIAAPMYGLVQSLQGNLQKLVYILNEKAKVPVR